MQSRNKREGYYCGVIIIYMFTGKYRKKLIHKRKVRGYFKGLMV